MLPLARALIESWRPHQWVKNGLVIAPLLFGYRMSAVPSPVANAAIAFAVFCLLSSSIYQLNDLVDRESDREHPRKSRRPIASGRLPVPAAIVSMIVLVSVASAGCVWLSQTRAEQVHGLPFWTWPFAYASLNTAYSFFLKRKVIIDCLCIALGFQFRVLGGSAAIDVEPSKWILLCTFFFALFFAFCKRREELERRGSHGKTRSTMRDYTIPFLDQLIAPLAALSILTYALYTVDADTEATHGTKNLMFTVPIVVFGVFRYVYIIHTRGGGEDPARLLVKDRQMLASGITWLLAVWLVLR